MRRRGVICAARHLHMTPEDAKKFGLKDKDVVKARTEGKRGITFDDVIVRVNKDFFTELHLDIDEGNAANLKSGDTVEIIK